MEDAPSDTFIGPLPEPIVQEQNGPITGDDRPFLSGVVEGFYGRPWSFEQRRDLFEKLAVFGMNTYVYAPKDDVKHRSYWRDLYTSLEEQQLSRLMAQAVENNILFVYALSPGLDICYSCPKDLDLLKKKMDQIRALNPHVAFALFFDDIEPELKIQDRDMFHSFAAAQVYVTNEIFEHLGKPKNFLFCPTEYCASRAIPTVATSEYLNTLGSKLAPEVGIMWTGPKVISQTIDVEHIRELAEVLRRKPVIWDNLHANDYDQKRLFLGPYSGRSILIKEHLGGVLTNPNCEYEANFVAIHTLATWVKCQDEAIDEDGAEDFESDDKDAKAKHFHPRRALNEAIRAWIPEFYKVKTVNHLKIPNRKTTGTSLSFIEQTAYEDSCNKVYLSPPSVEGDKMSEDVDVASPKTPISDDMDMFIDASPKPIEETMSDKGDDRKDTKSMMSVESDDDSDALMQTEMFVPEIEPDSMLSVEDIELLVDLFYLPYQHGIQGQKLLREFHWLKVNGFLVSNYRRSKPQGEAQEEEPAAIKEWYDRAENFNQMAHSVVRLFNRLTFVHNRSLLYELYPYIWDIKGVISLLNSYVKWIGLSDGYKETFHGNEQEPWLYRGGLTGELQRQLPEESIGDFLHYKPPETTASKIYTIRPYFPADRKSVYRICYESTNQRLLIKGEADMICDREIGGVLSLSPEFCFVAEGDDSAICGYIVAVPDAKSFFQKTRQTWYPEMRRKYPLSAKTASDEPVASAAAERFMSQLHSDDAFQDPPLLFKTYPSFLTLSVMSSVQDLTLSKRMLSCVINALAANGSRGVYTRVANQDKKLLDFYIKLGFKLIVFPQESLSTIGPDPDHFLGRPI